jgi:hypothetical protein
MSTVEIFKQAAKILNEQSVPIGPTWIHVPEYGAVNLDDIPDNPIVHAYFAHMLNACL